MPKTRYTPVYKPSDYFKSREWEAEKNIKHWQTRFKNNPEELITVLNDFLTDLEQYDTEDIWEGMRKYYRFTGTSMARLIFGEKSRYESYYAMLKRKRRRSEVALLYLMLVLLNTIVETGD